MSLPFTRDQFLDVFAAYNRAAIVVAGLLWLLTAAALADLSRHGPSSSRRVSALLSLQWAWAGVAYHFAFFRAINPAAILFATLFLLQAALLAWVGVVQQRLTLAPTSVSWRRAGAGLVAYALLYPALAALGDVTYPRLPSFGVPCTVTLLTVGVLLLAPRGANRLLAVIPLIWTLVGGSAAFLLDMRVDLALLPAGALLLAHVTWPRSPLAREQSAMR